MTVFINNCLRAVRPEIRKRDVSQEIAEVDVSRREIFNGEKLTRKKASSERLSALFSQRIYEDPSLAFIETSGGREKGKARAKLLRARVCVPRRIRHAVRFERTRGREKGKRPP